MPMCIRFWMKLVEIMNEIIFIDDNHKNAYYHLLPKMKNQNLGFQAFAYLLTLDPVCREHIQELFDIETNSVIMEGLSHSWHTEDSRKTAAIAFFTFDDKLIDIPSQYSADEIYHCEYTPYYWQATEVEMRSTAIPPALDGGLRLTKRIKNDIL